MKARGVPVACNHDCGGGCTLLAYTENGRVTGFARNPHAGRHHMPCVRGFQMHRVQYHEDRLTKPLIRTGPRGSGLFREATWGEALDTVARRLGFGDCFSEGRDEEGWLEKFLEESEVPDVEEFKAKGIHRGADQRRVAFAEFAADPEGYPLGTPSGLIQISSEAYALTEGTPVPTCRALEPNGVYPLRLITPKPRYRIHSQSYNIEWFRERERHALWVHPADAAEQGVEEGDRIKVTSPRGAVMVEAHVTGDVLRGVVSLSEGAWPRFDEEGVDHNGSVNVLTSTTPTLPSHGSRTHSVLVQVEKCGP